MVVKHMRRYSTSFIIQPIKIKTARRSRFSPVWSADIHTWQHILSVKSWKIKPSPAWLLGMQNDVNLSVGNLSSIKIKIKLNFPFDSASFFCKLSCVCTSLFVTVFFAVRNKTKGKKSNKKLKKTSKP